MGMVYADILLINARDEGLVESNVIGEDEVRAMTVNMLVDTGAYMMCITETVREYLGLALVDKRKIVLGDGSVKEFDVAGPITVKFENRNAVCNALILPESNESILGAIPLEELDVIIHPQRQELIVNPEHPHGAVLRL
jgi:clan AA aspartic protease